MALKINANFLSKCHGREPVGIYFRTITIIDFDEQAQTVFRALRAQRMRIGRLDLRIAAIALSREATLVTRNRQDFVGIPALNIEDWSLPGDEVIGH